MAIDQHGDEVLHSIYGRKFGIDKGGYAVGLPGVRVPYETSTAASTLTAFGVSVLSSTAGPWTLTAPPAIGVEKTIISNSTISTGTLNIIRSSSDSGVSFTGSTGGSTNGVNINLVGHGTAITLVGISTVQWAVKSVASFQSSTAVNVAWVRITTSS